MSHVLLAVSGMLHEGLLCRWWVMQMPQSANQLQRALPHIGSREQYNRKQERVEIREGFRERDKTVGFQVH